MGAAAIKAKKEKKKENFLKSHIILKINELPKVDNYFKFNIVDNYITFVYNDMNIAIEFTSNEDIKHIASLGYINYYTKDVLNNYIKSEYKKFEYPVENTVKFLNGTLNTKSCIVQEFTLEEIKSANILNENKPILTSVNEAMLGIGYN